LFHRRRAITRRSGKEPAKEPIEKDAGEKDAARANLDDASLPDGEKPAPEGEADTGAEADASVGLSSAEASVGVSSAASAPPRVWMATESMGEAASSCLGFYGAAFDAAGRRILAHSHGGALHLWRRSDDGTESGDGTESAPGASSTPQSATPQSATPRASSGKPPAVPGGKKSPGRKITVTRTTSTRTVVKRDASSAPETTVVKEVTTTRTVDDDAENAAAVAVVVNGKSSAKTKTNPNPKASSAADPGSAGPGFERTLSTETLGSSDPGEEGEHPENARPPPENAALGPRWVPAPACSGHAGDVACLSWDVAGRFLLTGSGDLTTRLHARWDAEENDDRASIPSSRARGWRQIARPQAHGHAIACVAALPPPRREGGGDSADDNSADDDDDDDDARGGGDDSGTAAAATARAERKLARLAGSVSFVSGADEKTLRVFEAPGTFLGTMARSLPASDARGRAAFRAAAKRAGDENALGAELPQLGLSNKAVRGAAPEGWLGVDDAPPANDDVAAGATPSRAEKKPSSDAGAGGPFEGSDSPKTPKGGPESADAGEEKPRTPARSPSFLEYLGLASPEPEEKTRAEGEEAAPEGDEEKAGEAEAEAEEEEEEEISAAAFARNPPAAEATHPSKEPSNASPTEAADPSGVSMPAGRSEAAVAAGGAPRGRSDSDSEDPSAEKPPTRSEDPGSEDPGAKKTSPPEQTDPSKNAGEDSGQPHSSSFGRTTPSALSAPPPEEVLAQATLWPESRKIYGHGNDLSCVASHPAGTLVASACKAQSAGAASVWFWDPLDDWKPLGNLPGATLTVVALQFANAKTAAQDMLLAASRDRHVCLYVPASVPAASETGGASGVWGESGWTLATRVKAHAKALLSAAWAPRGAHTFATAGRDKRVRVWAVDEQRAAIAREELPAFDASPTAVAFAPRRVKGRLVLAVGSEDGGIRLFSGGRILIGKDEADGSPTRAPGTAPWLPLASANFFDAHAGAVRALAWRPTVKVVVEAGAGAAGGTGARTTTTGGGDDGSRSGASTRSRGSRASSRGGSPRSLSPSASSLYFGLAGMVLDTEPDEESDEEDVEADEAMTLASCGADRAVRLFSVRRRGGAGGSASSGQREASPFARH
jgi:WD40 repeat protein